MDSNKKRKILIRLIGIIAILCTSLGIMVVHAENTSGGTSSNWGNCTDCSWKFDRVGVRLSLYSYDKTNLYYYSHVDFCSVYENLSCPKGNVYQHTTPAGKVAHQQISEYDNGDSWVIKSISSTNDASTKFPSIKSWDNVEAHTISMFALDTENRTEILKQIKTYFPAGTSALTENDLDKIYITIEPTVRIYNVDLEGTKTYFYGTAYELAAYFNGDNIDTLNDTIYRGFPEYMMAQKISTIDKYNFVGTNGTYVTLAPTPSELNSSGFSKAAIRNANVNLITSQIGYGINVFWLGSFVTSCEITQDSTTGVYELNIEGNGTNYTYGISNVAGVINDKLSYKATKEDTNIYGTIKNISGDIIATCDKPRTPTSCLITNNSDTYNLTISGNQTGIKYGISNIQGTTDGTTKYTITDNNVTTIYGTITDYYGNELATCSATRTKNSCSNTCTGKTGNDLLSCAENFCQVNNQNTNDKKTCITSCGYKDPNFSSCKNETASGKNTECEATATSSNTTCISATPNTYYTTSCIETSTIQFGNTLSSTLLPQTGFEYTPILTGSKVCTITFEKEKWEFDYASAYNDNERKSLLDILNKYIELAESSSITSDGYKYQSNDALIKLKITRENSKEKLESITLEEYSTTNLLKEEFDISTSDNINISLYANGKETEQELSPTITITSSSETTYRLPGICRDRETLEIYEMKNGNCNNKDDGPHYKYFVGNELEQVKYNTLVTVEKETSSLNVNNACYYQTYFESPKTGNTYIYIIISGLFLGGVLGFVIYKKNHNKNNK